MNTIQLECFLAVAGSLSFARAADEIHITQPAVTHQIRSLEAELEVRLFKRTTRSVSLTQEGLAFLPDARNILQAMHRAKGRMKTADGPQFTLFSIGCHNTQEYDFLPSLLKELHQTHPDIHPVLKSFPFRALENMLEEEAIDLMFRFQQTKPEKHSWVFHKLADAACSCILPASHPHADTGFSEKLLQEENLILLEPRRLPPELFSLQSPYVSTHHPSRLYFCDDFDSTFALIRAGFGVTVLPDIPALRQPDLRYLPIPDTAPLSYGIYYKGAAKNEILTDFLKIADRYFSAKVPNSVPMDGQAAVLIPPCPSS